MNKYIADTIRNNTNSLCDSAGCTKPQREAVRDIVRGLLEKGVPVLRQLGDRKTSDAKKESERFGKHLEKIDIADAVNGHAVRKAAAGIGDDDVIAYDLTDAVAEHSKGVNPATGRGMEWTGKCFDGSKRESSCGTGIHGVGVNGILLRLRIHDADREFLPQVRKDILGDIIGKIGSRGIWAFDRGNDDGKLVRDLNGKKVNGKAERIRFIVRLKKNRDIIRKDTGEVLKLEEMGCGRYEVCLRDDRGRVDAKNTYLLVIRKHCKKYETPIRILCSRNLQRFSGKALVKKYLERWGVENSFKRIKSLYGLEDIRVMKRKRYVSLVALIQFVSVLSAKLHAKTEKAACFLSSGMQAVYRQYLKRESLTENPHSFGMFLRIVIPMKYRSKASGGRRPGNVSQITLWEFFGGKLGMF